jgi:hypothetical protein
LVAHRDGAAVHPVRASTVAKNPRKVGVRELFTTPPDLERHYFKRDGFGWQRHFSRLDHIGRLIDPLIPKRVRAAASPRRKALVRCPLERRGRTRRDLSGHGQRGRSHGDAWAIQRTIRGWSPRSCLEEAAGGERLERLLPALRLAHLGYGLACLALQEIGDEASQRSVEPRARLAANQAAAERSPAIGR